MALVNLFDSLTGVPDTGGSWIYSLTNGGNLTCEVDTIPVVLAPGDPVGLTHYSEVDFLTVIPDTYIFEYTVGTPPCNDSASLSITVVETPLPDAGPDQFVCQINGVVSQVTLTMLVINRSDSAPYTDPVEKLWIPGITDGVPFFPSYVNGAPTTNTFIAHSYRVTPIFCDSNGDYVDVYTSPNMYAGVGDNLVICQGDTSVDLQAQITGQIIPSGGTSNWVDDDATGVSLVVPTSVNFSAVPLGTYDFTYEVHYNAAYGSGNFNCEDTETITVTVSSSANAGNNNTANWCISNQTPFLLKNVITNGMPSSITAGGSWVATSVPGGTTTIKINGVNTVVNNGNTIGISDNPTVALVDGSSASGTYVFTYTISGGCGSDSATLTVTAYEITISQNPETCDFSHGGVNPVDFTNTPQVVILNNSSSITQNYLYRVYSSCPAPNTVIHQEVVSGTIATIEARYNQEQGFFSAGGYMNIIRVGARIGGITTIHDINVSPSGATLTGCGGTTTSGALVLTATNAPGAAAFQTAVSIAFLNGLCAATGLTPSNVSFEFEMNPPNYNRFKWHFDVKNNPSGGWVGIDSTNAAISYSLAGGSITSWPSGCANCVSIVGYGQKVGPGANVDSGMEIPCGVLSGFLFGNGPTYNVVNFYSMTVVAPLPALSIATDGSPTINGCGFIELTANYSPSCSGTPTYLWSTGETTQMINVLVGDGVISVTGNCSTILCSSIDSVTV